MGKVVIMAKGHSRKAASRDKLRAIRTRIPGGASITRYFKRKPVKAKTSQSRKSGE